MILSAPRAWCRQIRVPRARPAELHQSTSGCRSRRILNLIVYQIMRRVSRIMEDGDKVGCMPDTATYTHGHAESVLRSHRTRTAENSAAYLLPYLRAGQSLLDVGSGPGTITVDLAARGGPGAVTGGGV